MRLHFEGAKSLEVLPWMLEHMDASIWLGSCYPLEHNSCQWPVLFVGCSDY
jgi:hypothetical protein